MFKRTFTNLIEPLINDRFTRLNQSIDALKGLQIASIQNLQNQITNLNLDNLDIPSAYDIASEISIDTNDIDIDYSALARHIGGSLNIDAGDIASEIEISADEIANHISSEIANHISSYDIGRAIQIDASDISIDASEVASYIEIDPYDIARNISARDIASNIKIDANDIVIDLSSVTNAIAELSAKLTAIETQLATLSKPKATKKPTVKKPVAKKPTGKTTATKKPVTKKPTKPKK